MKFVTEKRKYIVFENDKSDDFDALDLAREILESIASNMNRNISLASEDYNLGVTKQDVLSAIAILDLLTEYGRCYIEYEEEN